MVARVGLVEIVRNDVCEVGEDNNLCWSHALTEEQMDLGRKDLSSRLNVTGDIRADVQDIVQSDSA